MSYRTCEVQVSPTARSVYFAPVLLWLSFSVFDFAELMLCLYFCRCFVYPKQIGQELAKRGGEISTTTTLLDVAVFADVLFILTVSKDHNELLGHLRLQSASVSNCALCLFYCGIIIYQYTLTNLSSIAKPSF